MGSVNKCELLQWRLMVDMLQFFCYGEYIMGLFEDSLRKLIARLTNIEISAATIMKVLRFSMEIVETTQLKGEAQMELCKKLIRTVVVEAPISDAKEKLLLDMIDQDILEHTIELVVDATRGHLDINAGAMVVKTCCLPLFR